MKDEKTSINNLKDLSDFEKHVLIDKLKEKYFKCQRVYNSIPLVDHKSKGIEMWKKINLLDYKMIEESNLNDFDKAFQKIEWYSLFFENAYKIHCQIENK